MRQFLSSILLATLISTAVEAQTIRKVPQEFATIQSAIVAAQNGDSVLVAPGVYVENINFLGKSITVMSVAGADVTTIDGGGVGVVVTFTSGEGPSSVLDGFTIRNGNGLPNDGGGIRIVGSPSVRHNRIVNNSGCSGVGIAINTGSPLIQANVISNNTAQGCSGGNGGGGILVVGSGSAQILDNTISNNSTNGSSGGGGISLSGAGTPLIRNNILTGNSASFGGGIAIVNLSDAKLIQNVIAGNDAQRGGGIFLVVPLSNQGPSITNNTIVDNNVALEGSAIYTDGYVAATTLKNNIVIGKLSQQAIFCGNFSYITPPIFAFNNVFADQAAAYSGVCTDVTGTGGNISAAPLFADRAAGNFRMVSGSPGIDGGDSTVPGLPALDLDAFPRIVPVAGQVDMGAYEFTTASTSNTSTAILTFGDQGAGTVSAPSEVTLTNTGTADLFVNNVVVTGEFSQTNTCQMLTGIPAGQSCTISVRFAPSAGGPRTGRLTVTSNSGSSVVSLSGNGVGGLTLTTDPLTFADQRIGTTGPAIALQMSNSGTVELNISSITTTGDFIGSNDCPALITAGAGCTISIRFAPTARGIRSGAVTINALGSLYIVSLSGHGVTPLIALSPTGLNFPNQAIGTTSASQSVTVSNPGDIALAINSISFTGDFNGTNNCGSSLAANATCRIDVVFHPTVLGFQSGLISVSDDTNGSPHTVGLSGSSDSSLLTPSPTSLDFGNQAINITSPSRFLILRNTGSISVTISSIVLSGEFAASSSGGCTFLSPNSICSFQVTFKPTTVGPKSGAFTITSPSLGGPLVIPLTGSGVDIAYSATSLAFSADLVGTTSPAKVVTVTNAKTVPVTFSGITVSGDFSRTTTCGATLAAGSNCTISVFFSPVAAGIRSGSVTVAIVGVSSDQIISLSGTGLDALPIPVITAITPDNRLNAPVGITLGVTGSGFSTLSVVRWAGADRPTTFFSSSSLTAVISASDLAAMGTIPVTVFNPAPGGGLSNRAEFVVYLAKNMTTNDIVYDRTADKIYAAVSGSSPNLANTLTSFEPTTGNFGVFSPIGSEPAKLAISDDSSTIYVALSGSAQVRPFDTATQTPGTAFGLGTDPLKGALLAEDISVSPGQPGTIAVSRKYAMGSPRHAGVAIYDNGVKRTLETPDFAGSNVIEFSASPSILYGFNVESTEAGFRTMSVDSSGVSTTNVTTSLVSLGTTDIQFEGGRIYATSGQVIDPINRTQLGKFTLPTGGTVGGIAADSKLQRVFVLFASQSSVRILAYDSNSFSQVGSVTLPPQGISLGVGSLRRWGERGLAFRSATQVLTLQIPQGWLPPVVNTLTVSKTGSGSGKVTSAPAGIDCGATCSSTFTSGQVVTLTATPLAGSIFAGWSGDADCTDGSVVMSVARNCTARFALPPVATDDFYRVDKGGTLSVSAPGVLANDTDAEGNPITAVQMTSTIHGSVTLNADGSFSYTHNGGDVISDSFTYKTNDGLADSNIATVNLSIEGLLVSQFLPTTSGFVVQFNRPIDTTVLNLYGTETGGLGPADVTLVGASVGAVSGSLVVSGSGGTVTFIRTGGVLPPDTYTATLRSAANGFQSPSAGLLDGNHDGIAGDNFSTTFTVSNSPTVIVSVPDFLRGPGQPANLSGSGIPVTLNDGSGVLQVDLMLQYDPSLLLISQVLPGAGLPAGSQLQAEFSAPDRLHISVLSAAPLGAGIIELLRISAQVPATAPYGASQILAISNLSVNNGAIAAVGDDGLHVSAYFGDATGNGSYSSLDAQRILRVVSGLDSGFAAYARIDPVIVGDITGNGILSSLDASRLLQEIVGIDRPEIPPLP